MERESVILKKSSIDAIPEERQWGAIERNPGNDLLRKIFTGGAHEERRVKT